MNENEFEYKDRKFTSNEGGNCIDCWFYNHTPHCSEITPSCLALERVDGIAVNFLEVEEEIKND